MKHLKKYNESIEEKKSFEDIRDICLELEDDGFDIFYAGFYTTGATCAIRIAKPSEKFLYTEVKEVLLRLKDYLGSNYDKIIYDKGYRTNLDYDIRGKISFLHFIFKNNGKIT